MPDTPRFPKGSGFLLPPPNFIGPPELGLFEADAKGSFDYGVPALAKGSDPPILRGASSQPPKFYPEPPTFGWKDGFLLCYESPRFIPESNAEAKGSAAGFDG